MTKVRYRSGNRNEIRLWATKCQAGFLRMGKAKYALIFDFRTLENIEAKISFRFSTKFALSRREEIFPLL